MSLKRKKPLSPRSPCTRASKRSKSTANSRPQNGPSSPADVQSGPADPLEHRLNPDIPEVIRSKPYSGPKTARTQLALGLPPLHKLDDIYKSLTTRAMELGFDKFLSHLGSRPLRVVTVCSGTESPLLALEMVQDNLQKHFNKQFNFRHLFSAEIVPFKQAYIERNFHPRFIFRDVAELKDRVAQTAYGSLEKIPKNPDILIAGFSCVDFSGLNNKRKTLDEKGESGGTFWGIIRYAKTYRPRMVILENVKMAPWDKIARHWGEIDYLAVHMDVDTKAYYLPQTRERGYMFCVDRRLLLRLRHQDGVTEDDMLRWTDVLADFKRPASSPAGMFLIDADDRRLEQIEKDMAIRIASSTARATVNWARYQVRHQSYRLNQGLGHKRPVSKSQDDGTCQMPDFVWHTWVKSLPERVWDTIDVNFLRKLVEGYDMNYKERCIELSQGVEREIDSRAYGIVGCITPCGIPYITSRGGPLCGLESLALQGLPLDRLLLTQESQRELQDLAGNAMSSTVVGAAILSALIVGHRVLEKGDTISIPRTKPSIKKNIAPREDGPLVPSTMDLTSLSTIDLPAFLKRATSSARYCMCERQTSTRELILRCTLCGHTACSDCAGNPPHAYERCTDLTRSAPLNYIGEIKAMLPPRLVLAGISEESYDDLRQDPQIAATCPPSIWRDFLAATLQAFGDELRFSDIKRSEVWTVIYEGRYSILKLIIGSDCQLTWLLFAKPSDTEPTLCLQREILSKPIARMVPASGAILDGEWEVCAPLCSSIILEFSGTGAQIQSYEAKCGLEIPEYAESQVWSQIKVDGSDEEVKGLEVDIRGTYDLLPECGTANACLHKRSAVEGKAAVYLFLDPTKLGEPKHDSFVFSLEHRRNSGYAARVTIGEVSHHWRSSNVNSTPEPVAVYYRKWVRAPKAVLSPYTSDSPIRCYILDTETVFSINNLDCHNTNGTLLSFSVPEQALGSAWASNKWDVTNPLDYPNLIREFSWLLQKASGFSAFQDWRKVNVNQLPMGADAACNICVPQKPRILWGRNKRGWIKAYEDPHDAALFERQIKSRPPPFLIFRRIDDQHVGNLRITLNLQTLLHQAYERLARSNCIDAVSFKWRLVPNSCDTRDLLFPKFKLISNRKDSQASQPRGFLLNLRPEQLRSLSWMIRQEDHDIEPFIEEETEEALLPSLMWRAEGRVTAKKTIRGGILADDVGYGKTAIVLGLIDAQYERTACLAPAPSGSIPAKATLIVVPHIMVQQWQSEIDKFLGTKYKVLVFHSAAALSKKTIREIQDCDIILVSWSVFNTPGYYQKMQRFTGAPKVPTKAGRHFDDWFLAALTSLKEQVRILTQRGPSACLDSLREKRQRVKNLQEHYTYVPSKRLRGKQYEQANRQADVGSKSGVSYAEISSEEEESDACHEEDPAVLWHKVSQLLRLVPTKSQDEALGGLSATDSTDEDTEYGDSSAETKSMKSDSLGMKSSSPIKRKRNKNHKRASIWDDRKEFNIYKDLPLGDWEAVKMPLFHAFTFNRIVIDEFTYANPDRLEPLFALQARSKWVLSGTPPLNDFADVKTIAPFLGVHLGVDEEDSQSQNKRLRMISKQRSEAEVFQSFRAPRSDAWHKRRHDIAQRFLDRFARRNVAEIDEIPFTEHIILLNQSPAEKAVYLELYKQLMTYNRQLRRSGRSRFSSDQTERLDEIISSSSTAEEALLKRCTSLALAGRWDSNGKPEAATCASLIQVREEQLENLKADLHERLKLAAWVYCACDVKYENFHKFIESVIRHDFGDTTVTSRVYPLLKTAILTSKTDDWKPFFVDPTMAKEGILEQSESDSVLELNDANPQEEEEGGSIDNNSNTQSTKRTKRATATPSRKKPKGVKPASSRPLLPTKPVRVREFEPILREVTTAIRNLVVEWVLRERSLRFLKTVRDLQQTTNNTDLPQCHHCQSQPDLLSEINVLGSCGHALCQTCTIPTRQREECIVEGCRGSGKRFNIINASTLGSDEEDTSSQYGGTKLDKLIDIVQATPRDERVLLFIQFPELIDVASKALTLAAIKHTSIQATDRKSRQKIEQFQRNNNFGDDKVLILNLGSEMAAGLNLQSANHVIFLSPLHTQTQYDYDSTMTQAIGRSRRYGQTRHVHVYHLLAKRTVDINIFQDRHDKRLLVERGGEALLVSRDDHHHHHHHHHYNRRKQPYQEGKNGWEEHDEEDALGCQGPSLVVDDAF